MNYPFPFGLGIPLADNLRLALAPVWEVWVLPSLSPNKVIPTSTFGNLLEKLERLALVSTLPLTFLVFSTAGEFWTLPGRKLLLSMALVYLVSCLVMVLTSVDFQYIEKEFGYPFYVSFLFLISKALF